MRRVAQALAVGRARLAGGLRGLLQDLAQICTTR